MGVSLLIEEFVLLKVKVRIQINLSVLSNTKEFKIYKRIALFINYLLKYNPHNTFSQEVHIFQYRQMRYQIC